MIHQGRNWSDAQAYCQATYTDLAIIENQDYMNRFVSDSQKQQLNSSAWIGLYNDINSWRWSFGNEPLGSMTKWMRGEPNNNGGCQECVAIHPKGWTDRFCKSTFSFVCFDGEETIHVLTLAVEKYVLKTLKDSGLYSELS